MTAVVSLPPCVPWARVLRGGVFSRSSLAVLASGWKRGLLKAEGS